MKVNKKIILPAMVVLLLSLLVMASPELAAAQSLGLKVNPPTNGSSLIGIVQIIINTLLAIIGTIAVVMLILGGIKYTTSQGDEKAIVSAKNTILYAIIGIVVAFAAWAIIGFVLNQLEPGSVNTN